MMVVSELEFDQAGHKRSNPDTLQKVYPISSPIVHFILLCKILGLQYRTFSHFQS